jgi:hypothetical protein
MPGGNGQELARLSASRRPDALDEWRIRRAIFNRQEAVLHRGRALIVHEQVMKRIDEGE